MIGFKPVLRFFTLLFFFASLFFVSGLKLASAAQIKNIKGKKVTIRLSKRDRIRKGETWEVLTNKGKRMGLVKITGVKGKWAVGMLVKGKARKKLWLRNTSKRKKVAKKKGSAPEPDDMASLNRGSFFGGMAGLGNNIIEITQDDDSKIEYTGSSFGVSGFFDYPMYDALWVRGILGYQGFLAESNDDDRKIDTGYLQIGAIGRYPFSKSSWRPWAGAFVYASIPMSKVEEESESAVTPDSVTTTSFFGLAFGLDIIVGGRAMIPIQFEYGFFPPSDDANATAINIKIGYGVAW